MKQIALRKHENSKQISDLIHAENVLVEAKAEAYVLISALFDDCENRFHKQKFRNGHKIPCITSASISLFLFSCRKATVKVKYKILSQWKRLKSVCENVAKFFAYNRMGNQKKLPNQVKINFIKTNIAIKLKLIYIYSSFVIARSVPWTMATPDNNGKLR